MFYVICVLIGIMMGTICTLLFFQSDRTWIKIVSPLIGISGTGVSYTIFIKNLTGEINKEVLQGGLVVLLLSIILTAIAVLFALCKVLKDKDGNQVIRMRDILLGQKKFVESIYEQRVKEINAQSYSKILEKDKAQLEADRAELILKEQDLNNRIKRLNEQLRDKIILSLPIDSPIPVTNEFLSQCPSFIEGLAKFINDVNRITDEYVEKPTEDSKKNFDLLHSYFLALCSFAMEDIFDTTSKNVRIHFRVLQNNQYVKFVAKMGKSIYEQELTPIPVEKSMIYEAYINQTSLIKSLNSQHNYKSRNRNIWEDYMTISFYDICQDNHPFISMGISVRNKEKFKYLLYFLNFNKIENFIQENLYRIDKAYNIIKTVNENFKKNSGGVS